MAGVGWVDQDGEADSLGIVLSRPLSDGPSGESTGAMDAPVPDVLVAPAAMHATRAAPSASEQDDSLDHVVTS